MVGQRDGIGLLPGRDLLPFVKVVHGYEASAAVGHPKAAVAGRPLARTAGFDPLRALGSANGDGGFGGHCGHCEPCWGCWLIDGRNLRIPGISYSGGYAEAIVAYTDALAAIPD